MTATLEHVIDVDADPNRVYDLWTTAAGLSAWFGRSAEADTRVGGAIRIDVDGNHVMVGEFVELDPPDRLTFTFGWDGGDPPPGSTTVTVSIESRGSGSRVRLMHSGLPVGLGEAHTSGWTHYLGELADAAASAK